MHNVVANVMAISVITAPAATNPSALERNTTAGTTHEARRASGGGHQKNRASVSRAKRNGASRAPNSPIPNTAIVVAVAHTASGGLPQNGIP